MPLILAWALSIHKSQGQTLERVKVDLGRVFEKGQGEEPPVSFSRVVSRANPVMHIAAAYVAISRATSLTTLQVLNFGPDM